MRGRGRRDESRVVSDEFLALARSATKGEMKTESCLSASLRPVSTLWAAKAGLNLKSLSFLGFLQ